MRLKTQRRAIYAAMGLTVLALTGGFALATVSIGSVHTSQQGSDTTNVQGVAGLSYSSAMLVVSNGSPVINTTGCTQAVPCVVTHSDSVMCVGGTGASTNCAIGEFVEQITLTTTAGTPLSGELSLVVYLGDGVSIFTGATLHYTDAAGNTQQSIVQDFDLGPVTGTPTAVSTVSIVANVP